ncbi:shikimate kinase [Planctomycetota bacterium]
MKRNVALVGFRCTGKTVVGKALAERIGFEFRDADVVIEERAGKTIARIFSEDGEPAFRAMEVDVTAELCAGENCVVATGGGAVMNPQNIDSIKTGSFAVLLKADSETILRRMGSDPETARMRPALTDMDHRREIEHLLDVRAEAYQSAADMEIDTSSMTVHDVVDTIAREFSLRRNCC